MKKIIPLFCLIFTLLSCNKKISSTDSSSRTFHRKKIAVLPFQIHNTIDELPEGVTIEMVDLAERDKCQIIQLHLFRYLLREYAKSDRKVELQHRDRTCLLYTSPSPRDQRGSRMPSSA